MSTDRDDGPVWRVLDHVCASCFGRVLRLADPAGADGDGSHVYRCSNCGREATGDKPAALCACGIALRTGKDARIRCTVQRQPTPECPAQVVAVQR